MTSLRPVRCPGVCATAHALPCSNKIPHAKLWWQGGTPEPDADCCRGMGPHLWQAGCCVGHTVPEQRVLTSSCFMADSRSTLPGLEARADVARESDGALQEAWSL